MPGFVGNRAKEEIFDCADGAIVMSEYHHSVVSAIAIIYIRCSVYHDAHTSVCREPSVYWYTHRYILDKCYNVLGFPQNIVAGYITMQMKRMEERPIQ